MLRKRFIVELNRALMRRALTKSPRWQPIVTIVPPISRKYSVRMLSSISDNINTFDDPSFQSTDEKDYVSANSSYIAEASRSSTMAEPESLGPPDSAIKRALKNEPDDEWDFIVELQQENISEELTELQDEADASESNTSKNNEMFYDWQWKIIGTARLLELPIGSWTQDQWFSAENILLNGWPEQNCIRAVVLQFALLRRACNELDHSNTMEQQQLKPAESTANPSTASSSPYNKSIDSSIIPSVSDPVYSTTDSERKFGKKMLSRLFSNWRNVYTYRPELLRQFHLSPKELLDDVLNLYCGKYNFPVSEKVFRYILVAESSHQDGCKPEFAEQILSHCLDLYDTGMEDCFPTTPLWNDVLLSWVNADRRQTSSNGVARIVRLMEELKVQRSRHTYRILFRECLQRGTEQSARDAEGFLRQMYKEFLGDNFRVQPDMSSFIYVADAWAKSKSQLAGPRAEQIYEQMKALREKNHLLDDFNREVRLVTCILLCYIGVGSAAAAQKAEDFYRRTGVSPDASIFSALISLYAKNSDLVGAERIWNELISSNSDAMNTKEIEFSASAFLDACARANIPNKVEKAESIFSWLRNNKSINIDIPCYNAYLKVLMTDNNVETNLKAHEVLKQMREGSSSVSAKPTVISYTTVMNGWAQKGNFERASEVLRLMYDDYVNGNVNAKPDIVSYNTILTAYLRSKDKTAWSRAAALVEHMKKIANEGVLDIHPDVVTMSTALKCFALSTDNRVEAALKAEEMLNEMRKSYQNGNFRLQPNSYCYNNVMDIWARQGKPDKVEAIFLQMCKDVNDGNSAAKPITSTYNILLKAWSFSLDAKAVERSEQIIEQMKASNVKPDMRSYTTLISCYGRSTQRGAPQKADKVLRYMDTLYDQGILKEGPSLHTFLSLRKAWKVSNEPDKDIAIASLDNEIRNRFRQGIQR